MSLNLNTKFVIKLLVQIILFSAFCSQATGGRTNSDGCHNSKKVGYHCHSKKRKSSSTHKVKSKKIKYKNNNFKSNKFNCKPKYCGQMRSCKEAYYHLNVCVETQRDADSDGVPCESICR